MINFYIIQQTKQGMYKTFSLIDNFNPILFNGIESSIDLCRLRLGKTLQQNNIKVLKIPFVNITVVW